MHIKCRGGLYPRSNVERFPVPDEKVGWSVEYENYKPVYHSASSLHSRPWDPEIEEKKDWDRRFRKFFSGGKAVYKGYMDDHRNTDNAWIESVAYSFHDDTGATVGALSLNPGDDAVGVQWADITPQLKLYVNHNQKVDEAY
ncbi:ADP-ribose pyrophosphatase, mitochondrial [Operophtera brumata]|uniref:ADP-ribose pyrophosphatase, mitochondrial n=1 Tax=Operophtera brumata TaxID=104452 RepID=A0A0L7L8L7_OPEBR|nr:ADP-ribose pyrophosphatase, mitochondrial [Operophtera brumata]